MDSHVPVKRSILVSVEQKPGIWDYFFLTNFQEVQMDGQFDNHLVNYLLLKWEPHLL